MEETTNKGGAPEGNQNAKVGSLIRGAIRRALSEDRAKGRDTLNQIIRKMLDDAVDGDKDARRETFDRMDGKPKQQTEITGADEGPVEHSVTVKYVAG